MMSVLDKNLVRGWLTQSGIENFECGHCDGVHLSALDAGEGPMECRIMWQSESLLLLTQIELRPSAIIPISAVAVGLCVECPELKIHVESPDEEPASLVISHAIPHFVRLTQTAVIEWVSWYLSHTQRVIEDVRQTGLFGSTDIPAASGGALH